ncbi:MAG TPA: ADOP family duplicated permease [Gemmatimonadaceae bacterium]
MMSALRAFVTRVLGTFGGARRDGELERELEAHVTLAADEYVRRGLSAADARRQAIIDSGGIEHAKEAYRDQRSIRWMETLRRDVRTSARSLRRDWMFTGAVLATLMLTTGATTMILSAIESVVLRPLPVARLDRIITIGHGVPELAAHAGMQAAEVFDLEKRNDLFDAVAGFRPADLNLTGAGTPQHITAVATTGQFFEVFDVRPYLGRLYTRADVDRGTTSVVVMSYDLWREVTGGDRRAIGRTFELNDSSYTLIGVLPPRFAYPTGAELWTPKTLNEYLDRNAREIFRYGGEVIPTVARLPDGVTLPQVQASIEAAQREWAAAKPEYYTRRNPRPIETREFTDAWSGELRPILVVLVGAVALVVLIACANIACLQLLRAAGRSREIAIRIALGGSRADVLRESAVETVLLAIGGGGLGLLLARGSLDIVSSAAAARISELGNLRIDPFVLACTAAVTTLAALLFGLLPALRASNSDPRAALSSAASRSQSASVAKGRFLRTAVVAQFALALALLLSSAVAVRSLQRLLKVNPGFSAANVLAARLTLPAARGSDTSLAWATHALALHERILARLRTTPGIEAAGETDVIPFGYHGALDATIHRMAVTKDFGADAMRQSLSPNYWYVDGGYFRTMEIPLLAGPGFTGHEQDDQVRVYPKRLQVDVVIDAQLAQRLFPGENAIGKSIGPNAPGLRIVGVVGSVKKYNLGAVGNEDGAIYLAAAGTQSTVTIVLRTRLPTSAATALLRNVVASEDPTLPVFDVQTLPSIVERSTGSRQVASWLLVAFAALSFVLAVLGIYAVLSYATSQRMKELGIRMALGAQPFDVVRVVLASGAWLAGAGVFVGVGCYLAVSRALAAITYGVNQNDPTMIGAAAVVLGASAMLACLPAAVRAARLDVVETLRAD